MNLFSMKPPGVEMASVGYQRYRTPNWNEFAVYGR